LWIQGGKHPSKSFLHKSQLTEWLNDLVVTLNKETKYGKYHTMEVNGKQIHLSPEQAYEEFFGSERLVHIPDSVRHLLRCNKIEDVPVTRNGIRFQFGKKTFEYKNHFRLGKLKGQTVSVWFNPSDPSTASVTDRSGKNPFVVSREALNDGSPEGYARAAESSRALNNYDKEVNRVLKPVFKKDFQDRMFRYSIVDRSTTNFGVETERQKAEIHARKKVERDSMRIAIQHRLKQGFPLEYARKITPEQADEIARLLEENRNEHTSIGSGIAAIPREIYEQPGVRRTARNQHHRGDG